MSSLFCNNPNFMIQTRPRLSMMRTMAGSFTIFGGDFIRTFKSIKALNSYIQNNVLKDFISQAGEKINLVIRDYIQSRFYDQYTPYLYKRTWQLLNSVTTAKPVKIGSGYEIEIYLDADSATYYDTHSHKEEDAETIFLLASQGYHGHIGPTPGRFMEEASQDIQDGTAYDIINDFRRYLGERGFKVI